VEPNLEVLNMDIGSCLLGYNDPDATNVVVQCVQAGSMDTLNVPEEVELPELLLPMYPWAESVRRSEFARLSQPKAFFSISKHTVQYPPWTEYNCEEISLTRLIAGPR